MQTFSKAGYATEGKYELFKTSATFEGTAKNADWLGDEVEGVRRSRRSCNDGVAHADGVRD